MKNIGLREFLKSHKNKGTISFHMPGHKNGQLYKILGYEESDCFDTAWDITEIEGADNLFKAEGVLRKTMDKYKELYESKESFLLVNGSSVGIIASILTAVPKGGKIIVARNSHRSIFNGIELGELSPVYIYPEKAKGYNITGEINPHIVEEVFKNNTDAKAIILSSPNYYGITSDIKTISEIAHKYGAIVIVDQAHGAHLKFMNKSVAAECNGADLVIVSTHKTLGSFTQTAVLNVYGERVDTPLLASKLEVLESSSPSYILMNSLDFNADILKNNGEKLFSQWRDSLDDFYRTALWIKGLMFMMNDSMDDTKINLDASFLGLDGYELAKLLSDEGIIVEMTDGPICMCITGIGNTREDYLKLLSALQKISADRIDSAMERERKVEEEKARSGEEISYIAQAALVAIEREDTNALDEIERQLTVLFGDEDEVSLEERIPWGEILESKEINWRNLSESETILVPFEESLGNIAARNLAPYPPGVPIVAKGEVITADEIEIFKVAMAEGKLIAGMEVGNQVMVFSNI
ncbi:aminotransferase class I/II-fold pyridoxal phosphate-dependent enzyme [Eubacteriales bacterium KG127]